MNFIFISPDFPKTYYHFCEELLNNGVNVLGIASTPYEYLPNELKRSLTEYYRVSNMEDYNEMFKAVAYFSFKYGKIDFIESNNEYWLEQDARLRSDFNASTGKKMEEINFFKSKEAMKECYKKANVKVARFIIPSTFEKGKDFAFDVGYPLVAKPDNGVGAYNTFKINNEEELLSFYKHKPDIKYIMEEFVPGDLISYDGVTNGDCEPIFSSNEVFPTPVMNIVNENKDCFYYSNKEMPQDLEEVGKRVLKAFDAKYRYFHLEFFRLNKDKEGLGKKGDIIGLEVNMRCPGGYTPDIINFSKSVNTYKIWADSMTFNKCSINNSNETFYCAYYGRRDGIEYLHDDFEIKEKYGSSLKMAERLPDIFSKAMGNDFYVINVSTLDELNELYDFLSMRKK